MGALLEELDGVASAGPPEGEDDSELYSVEHVRTRVGACEVHPVPASLTVRRCSLVQFHRRFWRRKKTLNHTAVRRHCTGQCEIGRHTSRGLHSHLLILGFFCV